MEHPGIGNAKEIGRAGVSACSMLPYQKKNALRRPPAMPHPGRQRNTKENTRGWVLCRSNIRQVPLHVRGGSARGRGTESPTARMGAVDPCSCAQFLRSNECEVDTALEFIAIGFSALIPRRRSSHCAHLRSRAFHNGIKHISLLIRMGTPNFR